MMNYRFTDYVTCQRAESVKELLSITGVHVTVAEEELLQIYKNRKSKIPVLCGSCGCKRAVSAASLLFTRTSTCAKCSHKAAAEARRKKNETDSEEDRLKRSIVYFKGKDERALGHCRLLAQGQAGKHRDAILNKAFRPARETI